MDWPLQSLGPTIIEAVSVHVDGECKKKKKAVNIWSTDGLCNASVHTGGKCSPSQWFSNSGTCTTIGTWAL